MNGIKSKLQYGDGFGENPPDSKIVDRGTLLPTAEYFQNKYADTLNRSSNLGIKIVVAA